MPGFCAREEKTAQFLRRGAVLLHDTSHDGLAALEVGTWRAKDQAFAHGWMRCPGGAFRCCRRQCRRIRSRRKSCEPSIPHSEKYPVPTTAAVERRQKSRAAPISEWPSHQTMFATTQARRAWSRCRIFRRPHERSQAEARLRAPMECRATAAE